MRLELRHGSDAWAVAEIRALRDPLYASDGVALSREDRAADRLFRHIACRQSGRLIGCLRCSLVGSCGVMLVGGWAARSMPAGVRVLLGAYALAARDGAWCVAGHATPRHDSASILERMGGRRLHECETEYGPMVVLVFDPRNPPARHADGIRRAAQELFGGAS